MPTQVPELMPRPRELTRRAGFLELSSAGHPLRTFLQDLPGTMSAARRRLSQAQDESCACATDQSLGAGAYRLTIAPEGIRITTGDAAGLLYAAQTLGQIHAQYPEALPCLEIKDAPVLAVRGFMLDVSRCRVPTQSELLRLVAALGALRANQLQLYVEHTFAFPGHEDAWRDASPLTPAEIAELDRACAEAGIELVPNLNTFGHMERWLRHPRYRGLAECPEGWVHPLTGEFKPFPGTLRPDEASLDFVRGLLADYLPCFSSRQVNIGGDEPWELGQGFSRDAVAARGKRRVYLDHLRKICALAQTEGRTAQFWGDILLEDLELAKDAPAGAVPVVWGYDAGHPFEAQCGRLRELGRTFLVAPGTSTWQSFTGRLDNALANQQEAVDAARRHGAAGVLLTCWGDNGHHQPWPTNWPAMADGFGRAWSGEAPADGDLAQATAILGGLGRADAVAVAAALTHLGRLDGCVGKAQRNRSLTWDFLTATDQNLPKHVADVSPAELRRSLAHLDEADRLSDLIRDDVVREELRLGTDLARAGLERALGEGPNAEACASLTARHRAAWLRRSRPGGLDESVRLLFGSRIDGR